jgi:diguanylate cyclase (GGDEF)-like protein
MFTVLACITLEHDLRLVFLAAMVCVVGAAITVRLLIRAQEEAASARTWPCLAGVSFGAAIWSTHFIAMLAFQPGMGLDYAIAPTLLSLLLAITVSTAAFVAFDLFKFPGAAALSGALVGLGVAGMHYLGMHALDGAGLLSWSADFVAASIFLGAAFGAVAMIYVARRKHLIATLLFVAAICALHFTGMAGVTIQPLAPGAEATSIVATTMFAAAAACGAMLIVGTGLLAFYIDQRASAQAGKRLKNLADAAIEGLLLVEGGLIIDWNKSFELLSGYDRLSGDQLAVSDVIKELALGDRARVQARHVLICADGHAIPIDVLTSSASPRDQIIAVRDLRDKLASEARIHFLAHYDALTGLPNRVAFLEHLDAALATEQTSSGELAVMAIDLDRFKEVNDVFGHGMGDRVLSLVADRMNAVLSKDEFLARVGGDEFVAVQVGGRQPEAATDFCDRLVQAATAPMEIDGNVIQLGVSIGISLHPKDGQTSSDLMANADLAMYRAKEAISSGGCFFSSEMDDCVRLRRSLARDLREAIDRGQLELFYQVQTSLTTSAVVGYEVLLRWNHPERGFIPPAQFIPIAEETGLIIQIGEWVIEAACRDAASWPEPYRVAVNVSGVQFSQGDLPTVVHAALFKSGLAPSRLELEITETVLISDLDRALAILRRLKGLGVSIAMDDFGTGYSSLSTLKAFPFDKIKIDRSFIEQVESQPQARSIIRAILALGRSLEIPVLAEGVETSGHLAFLRDEGCDEAQGYLLGLPGPLVDIPALNANEGAAMRRNAPRATASS